MSWPAQNPFVVGSPVWTDTSFANREYELEKLHRAARNTQSQHINISGPRRIGKTSLLLRFQAELEGRVASRSLAVAASSVFLDVRSEIFLPDSPDQIATALLRLLTRDLADRLGVESPDPPKNPHDFRRRVLSSLMGSAGHRRLVVLLDEVQLLDGLHEEPGEVMRHVFDAFATEGAELPPLLVACWSLGLGQVFDLTGLSRWLHWAPLIQVGFFDETGTGRLTELAVAYKWCPAAFEWLCRETGGHPLFLAAVNHVLWERRCVADQTQEVTLLEAMDCVADSIGSNDVETSLQHAWKQLKLAENRLGRALAGLTFECAETEVSEAPNSVTLDEIQDQLYRDGYPFETRVLMEALPGLMQNGVVKKDGDRYHLQAPFLGRWLINKDYTELTWGEFGQKVREARGQYRLGNHTQARELLIEAEQMDQLALDDLVLLAELEEEAGQHAEALEHYRKLWQADPGRGRGPLCESLVRQVIRLIDAGDDPASAWDELVKVDRERERIDQANVTGPVTEAYLRRWRQCIDCGDEPGASAAFVMLAEMNPKGWRDRAARQYVECLEYVTPDHDRLRGGIAAIRDVFLTLTDGKIGDNTEAQLGILEERFAGQPILDDIRAALAPQLRQPWWVETTRVLQLVWERRPIIDGPILPASVLEKLFNRAPDRFRDEIRQLLAKHLPARLAALFGSDVPRAVRFARSD
jgi:tetratricopeptide (TPR) repeat protein